jgi:predicted nuclease with TOPRIM domain
METKKTYKKPKHKQELNQYIKDSMCDYCGELHEHHKDTRECITALRNKAVVLEDRLEKLEDQMNSIRRVFRDSVDQDRW